MNGLYKYKENTDMLKRGVTKNHTYSYQKQHSKGSNAVKHELILIIESPTAAALIPLKHLLGARVHLVRYNHHI